MSNPNIKESTKKLLFEQHKSTVNSFDSAQDSLDKAFTAILFAEIAFYITKIKPHDASLTVNIIIVSYMALALSLVFYSFMKSKVILTLYKYMIESQIAAIDEDEVEYKNSLIEKIRQDEECVNLGNRVLVHINRQIPGMVFISSCFCFIKVCLDKLDIKIISFFIAVWIIISIVVFVYTYFKGGNYVKK